MDFKTIESHNYYNWKNRHESDFCFLLKLNKEKYEKKNEYSWGFFSNFYVIEQWPIIIDNYDYDRLMDLLHH